MEHLKTLIDTAFVDRILLTPQNATPQLKATIIEIIHLLDQGTLRVAEKIGDTWEVHEWIKKAILLYFRLFENQVIPGTFTNYYDKIPLKFKDQTETQLHNAGVRIVPPAVARKGAYIAANTILMPSYINIGAYIDTGVMVDTWATVGSCAQIGKNVHLSGGVGIGGVLEPLQARPTIIEDNCFIGARSEIVEGVIVEAGSVISMGVYLGQSTRIYHRELDTVFYGRVPKGSVVVPGSLPDASGKCSLYCAVIVKQVDEQTRAKTSINELLRDPPLAVS